MRKIILCCLILFHVSTVSAEMLKENFFRSRVDDVKLSALERLQYLDSIISDNPQNYELWCERGELAFHDGLYSIAADSYEYALDSIRGGQSMTLSEQCRMLRRLMTSRLYLNQYRKCSNKALQLLRIKKPDSLKYYDIRAYSALIDVLGSMNAFGVEDNGIRDKYIDRAVELSSRIDGWNVASSERNGILSLSHLLRMFQWTERGDLKHGLAEAKKALDYADDPIVVCGIKGTTAILYETMGEYDIAEEYYQKLFTEHVNHINMGILKSNYVALLNNLGRYDDVLSFCAENDDFMHLGNDWALWGILRNKATAYRKLNRNEEAYVALDSAVSVMDRLRYEINLIDPELLDKQVDEIVRDRGKYVRFRYDVIIIIMAVVLCLAGGFLIYWRRSRHRPHVAAVAEVGQQKSDYPDFASLTIDLVQRTSQLRDVKTLVDSSELNAEEKLRQIAQKLGHLEENGGVWDSFKLYFDRIYPSFNTALYHRHPDISATEARMCALMVLNLTTKEIALISNRSPRTVEASKYRIRKKFNLTDDVSTLTYLRSFL